MPLRWPARVAKAIPLCQDTAGHCRLPTPGSAVPQSVIVLSSLETRLDQINLPLRSFDTTFRLLLKGVAHKAARSSQNAACWRQAGHVWWKQAAAWTTSGTAWHSSHVPWSRLPLHILLCRGIVARTHLRQRGFGLGQPEGHVHSAVQVDGGGQGDAGLLPLAGRGVQETLSEIVYTQRMLNY